LEKQGIIQKYVGLLNREKLGLNIVVYCNVRLKEQSKKVLETFEKHIGKYDEVQEIISLSGEYDYMLKIIAKDINSYNEFAVNVISNIPNIGQYHSSIVLHEVKNLPSSRLIWNNSRTFWSFITIIKFKEQNKIQPLRWFKQLRFKDFTTIKHRRSKVIQILYFSLSVYNLNGLDSNPIIYFSVY
jgi:hypothetical protein